MADSPYWSIHIDGPVDSRCAQYEAAAVRTPPPGVGFYEEIGAGETRRFALPSLGIGQEGEYRVRVEYNGERAKEGEYRGVVRTNESVFRILPPTPTEQELVKQWLEENPELPWCVFPAGLEIFESHDLIVEYPTSLYAGWKLWGMIRGLAAAFPGAPSAVEPEVFLRTARESPNRVLGEQRIYSRENPKGTLLRTEAAARWRIEYLSAFLTAHGDFPKADEMRLRIAMDYIGLGDYKSAERQLEPAVRSSSQSKATIRAADYMSRLDGATN